MHADQRVLGVKDFENFRFIKMLLFEYSLSEEISIPSQQWQEVRSLSGDLTS